MPIHRPRLPKDYPSFLLYILDQTHVTLTAITAIGVIYTRNPQVLYFATGSVLSSLTAKLIKSQIRSPRPPPPPPPINPSSTQLLPSKTSSKTQPRPKKTYGMPSTHSTALTFFLIYLLPLPFSSSYILPYLFNPLILRAGLLLYWSLGIWSRVELGYHTYSQCFGGIFLGTLMAFGWRGGWVIYQDSLAPLIQGLEDWGFSLVGL